MVTLAASTRSVTITLTAVDDADASAETLTLALTAGTGYTVSATAGSTTVTINPMDETLPVLPALSVAAAPGAIQEGQTSTITITATTAPSGNLTIPYAITGSGITTGDYTLTYASGTEVTGLTGNIILQAAQTSIALTLTAADDADASAETLTLALTAGTGYTVSATAGSTTVTITPVGVTLPALVGDRCPERHTGRTDEHDHDRSILGAGEYSDHTVHDSRYGHRCW